MRTPAYSAALHEIGAYYEWPDLPDEGPIWGSRPLEDVAIAHARSIRYRAGVEYASEAASVLREATVHHEGAFMKDVVMVTRCSWQESPEYLAELQALMHAIADKLDAEAQRMSSPPDDDG